jgi:hypothetical protein
VQVKSRSGLVWSGLVWSGLVWSGLVWSGLVWSGLVWSGLVWSGLVWQKTAITDAGESPAGASGGCVYDAHEKAPACAEAPSFI